VSEGFIIGVCSLHDVFQDMVSEALTVYGRVLHGFLAEEFAQLMEKLAISDSVGANEDGYVM
jgi:hypothetical protein